MTKNIKKIISYFFVLMVLISSLFLFLNTMVLAQDSSSYVVGTVSVIPLEIEIKSPKSVFVNQKFNLQNTLNNVGQNSINDITLTLQLPAELVLVQGELVQNIKTISPKKRKKINWKIQATQTGNHIVQISISGTEQNTGELISTTASLTIKAKQKRFYHSILQSWLDFFNFIF